MKHRILVGFVVSMMLGTLFLVSQSASAMFDWGGGGGAGDLLPSSSGSGTGSINTNFVDGLALGDHHTQYPNANGAGGDTGCFSNLSAFMRIRDQDHSYSDFYGPTYEYGISTSVFNSSSVNTTTYPKQLLPPIPNSTINNVYVVSVMGPKYWYAPGEEFSMSLQVLVPLSAIQYNNSWNYTSIYPSGGLYWVSYNSPHFFISSSFVSEYRWDVSRFLNWTPNILRSANILVALTSFQPLTNGVGGSQISVDYLGLSYNWTYGINTRFTSPNTDFGGAFSLSTAGLMTVGGLMGLIITPAGVIWIAKHRETNRFALFVSAITIMTFFLAIFLAGGT